MKKLEKYFEKNLNFEIKYGFGWHFFIFEQFFQKL
jgi:hypothetical protein